MSALSFYVQLFKISIFSQFLKVEAYFNILPAKQKKKKVPKQTLRAYNQPQKNCW